ncbi:hypothetical protein RUND412_009318 [Rhizina undulata]
MASSPTIGRSFPNRGRGRGRPRLRGRGNSILGSRRTPVFRSTSTGDPNTLSGRRRPFYQNGYRPGGAGGGGRYVHPVTGETIPAHVYNALRRSAVTSAASSPTRAVVPFTPVVAPPAVGADGVYKPREERSYTEFHIGFDIEEILAVYDAEEVDGPDYRPPSQRQAKTVRIAETVEAEDEHDHEHSHYHSHNIDHREGTISSGGANIKQDPEPPADNAFSHSKKPLDMQAARLIREESLDVPIIPVAINGIIPPTTQAEDVVMGDSVDTNGLQMFPTTAPVPRSILPSTTTTFVPIAINPSLRGFTPPPPPPHGSLQTLPQVPIDPLLAELSRPAPPPQSPAITPTEDLVPASTLKSSTLPPVTPGTTLRSSRRGDGDTPTLASLRAHRTTAGKPPPRSIPPPTVSRRSRNPNSQNSWEAEKLNLPKPCYRKIKPYQFSEAAWSNPAGSSGPQGLNNPPSLFSEYITPAQSEDLDADDGPAAPVRKHHNCTTRHTHTPGCDSNSSFSLPPTFIRNRPDFGVDEELGSIDIVDQAEYDMDEQDDKWLTTVNSHRQLINAKPITRDIFEMTMTKTEKLWVALEKHIPKIVAKPHNATTARRRSSGRAGEDDAEEEGGEDSKCAICDDGECENSNAIVFCDGCNLAVHQECYGVPYIPEGQWLCRRCLIVPRQTVNCVFCPNTDGAFKQTNTNRWSHLLCAVWIPEVRLANTAFMEPVDGIELVPKSRWKLTCYICKQKMGACIQCSNKNCFIAFHVTCGRRARLHMKMKNGPGAGAQLESSGLKAYCDRHVPADWRRENDVNAAVQDAMEFYNSTLAGRLWGDSQAAAMAPDTRTGFTDKPGSTIIRGNKRKRGQPPKSAWKLPSGAPVIPHKIYQAVVDSLSDYDISRKEEYVAELCKYWSLKREARRGATLIKRLQLQMDSFTSVEVTRKNYAKMGHTQGTKKLERRLKFANVLKDDLSELSSVVANVVGREKVEVARAEMLRDFMDTAFFPEIPLIRGLHNRAERLDGHGVFKYGLALIKDRLEHRLYPEIEAYVKDLRSVLDSPHDEPRLDWNVNLPSYTRPFVVRPSITPTKSQMQKTALKIFEELEQPIEEAKESLRQLNAPATEGEANLLGLFGRMMDGADDRGMDLDGDEFNEFMINGKASSAVKNGINGSAKGTTSPKDDTINEVKSPSKKRRSPSTLVFSPNKKGKQMSKPLPTTPPAFLPTPMPVESQSVGHWNEGNPQWYLRGFNIDGLKVCEDAWNSRNDVREKSPSSESRSGKVHDRHVEVRSRSISVLPSAEKLADVQLPITPSQEEDVDEKEASHPLENSGTENDPGAEAKKNIGLAEAEMTLAVDHANDDVLLGGYRDEDLPLTDGEEDSDQDILPTNGTKDSDLPIAFSSIEDPLPLEIPETKDPETLTNNDSVLSDPPDEDEDDSLDMDMDRDETELTPRKGRRVSKFPRQGNGRFGSTRASSGGGSGVRKTPTRRKKGRFNW